MLECLIVGGIETNCWIYSRLDFCALIDPGDDAQDIIAFLSEKNLTPNYILLTHGHLDHLAALPDLADFFRRENPRPLIAIHKGDSCYLGSASYPYHLESMRAAARGGAPGNDSGIEAYARQLWKPQPDPDALLDEADTIGPFKVLHLPGHTPGSAAYFDEEAGILFSGDTLFCGDYGRTDLPGGNISQLKQSLKRVFTLGKNINVCPGHGPVTTIGREAGLIY